MSDAAAPPAEGASLPELRLKHREDRRISTGHLWIFSNEVDTDRTPLARFASGALCRVMGDRDRFLGYRLRQPACAHLRPHPGPRPQVSARQAALRSSAAGSARAPRAPPRDALVPAGVRRVRRPAWRGARPIRRRRRRADRHRRYGGTQARTPRGHRAGDRPGSRDLEERQWRPRARGPAGLCRDRARRAPRARLARGKRRAVQVAAGPRPENGLVL